jgi:hypothetical protein
MQRHRGAKAKHWKGLLERRKWRRENRTSPYAVDFWQSPKGKYLMSSAKFFWDPEHWHFRAEITRKMADQMTHEEARTIMGRIANDYDRLAKFAEAQLAHQEIGAIGP